MRNAALTILATVGLAGCAIQPPAQRSSVGRVAPAFVNAPTAKFTPETLSTALWTQLGDTTLSRLIELARTGNRDVRAAEARLRAARAERRLSGFDLFPAVTSAAGYTRQRLSAAQAPGVSDAGREQELWDAGVYASWEIDLFGRVRRTVAARSALEASAREDVRGMQLSLVAELARTYYELRGAQSQLAVARRNAENQKRTLQITNDRLDAGRGSALDRERATAQLNSTLATVPLFEARVASALSRITLLLGRSPEPLAPALAATAPVPALPARPAISTPEAILRARPDVRSAERQLAAQTALVGAARAEYLPRLGVSASAGLNATVFDSLGKSRTSRYSIGPVLSWPAFDIGRVKAQADASRARAEEARARYDQVVLGALSEAETALATFDRSRERLGYLRAAAEASERGADLAQLRFTNGAADFLEVLDSERTLLDAQDQLARGQTELVTAFVVLYKALGGVWPAQ